MKELGITMDLKSQEDNNWWGHFASDGINHLEKNASTLHVQKLHNSLAKEPISTQVTYKCATQS